ncbi:hypothetical protein PUN28_001157 [Cardiocondyla obscurior]|uniref:Uncharacterized protein n=1 Tax=Cardiocondyla obscurior TaxID=286306 RepID=A0AAW2H3V8_9HYME
MWDASVHCVNMYVCKCMYVCACTKLNNRVQAPPDEHLQNSHCRIGPPSVHSSGDSCGTALKENTRRPTRL